MSISKFFEKLGAPLRMVRQSWGAERDDGAVFLRVWLDRVETIDGKRCVRMFNGSRYEPGEESFGYKERGEQISNVRSGAKCYLVMCQADNPSMDPRSMKSFENNFLFVGGAIIDRGGDVYIEIADKVPVGNVISLGDA